MEVILLERVEKLGTLGDTVTVKPGYARNYLLPQGKALRANATNKAKFEAERAAIESVNAEKRTEAEKVAKKIDGKVFTMIRSASEAGQLFGSVTSRDIAAAIGEGVTRNHVVLEQPVKTIGFADFKIRLHPEVTATIQINVAQSEDEAKAQADRVARGEPAVVTAAEADATAAAEAAREQAAAIAKAAAEVEAEEAEAEGVEATEAPAETAEEKDA